MALLWKMICKLVDPMSLRHPVLNVLCEIDIQQRPSTNSDFDPFRLFEQQFLKSQLAAQFTL